MLAVDSADPTWRAVVEHVEARMAQMLGQILAPGTPHSERELLVARHDELRALLAEPANTKRATLMRTGANTVTGEQPVAQGY
jgi:hypothetical protein